MDGPSSVHDIQISLNCYFLIRNYQYSPPPQNIKTRFTTN